MLKQQKGYIALSTVLITLALVLLIGVSTSLLSINDLLSVNSGKISNRSLNIAEACVEDVLYRLNETGTIENGLFSLLDTTCSVTLNSHTGNDWDFTVSTEVESYYKNVRVNATKDTVVAVNSWQDE